MTTYYMAIQLIISLPCNKSLKLQHNNTWSNFTWTLTVASTIAEVRG